MKNIVENILSHKELPFIIQTMDTLGLLTTNNLLALQGKDLTEFNQNLEAILKLGRSNDISQNLFEQAISGPGLNLSANKESHMEYFLTRDMNKELKNTLSLELLKPENNDFFTHLQSIDNPKLNQMLLECINDSGKFSTFKVDVLNSRKADIELLEKNNLLSISILPFSHTASEILTRLKESHLDASGIIMNALESRNPESNLDNIKRIADIANGPTLLVQMYRMDMLEPDNMNAYSSALMPKTDDISKEIKRVSEEINKIYTSEITRSHADTNLIHILFSMIINHPKLLAEMDYNKLSNVLDTPFAKSLKDVDKDEMISKLVEKPACLESCLTLNKHDLLDQDHFNALMTTKHPVSDFIAFLTQFPGINLAGLDEFSSLKELSDALEAFFDKFDDENIDQTLLANQFLSFNQLNFYKNLPMPITAKEWDNFMHIPRTSYDINNFNFADLTSLNQLGLLDRNDVSPSDMSAIHQIAKAGFTADSFKESPKTLDKLIHFITLNSQNELLKLPILAITTLMDFNFKFDAERLQKIDAISPFNRDANYLTPNVLEKLLLCNPSEFETSLQCLKIMSVSNLLQPDKMDALFNHYLGINDALQKLQFQMKTPGSGPNVQEDEFYQAIETPNPQNITEQAFKDVFQRNLGWDLTVAVCQAFLSLFSQAPEPKKEVVQQSISSDPDWAKKHGFKPEGKLMKDTQFKPEEITVSSFQKKP